MEPLDEVKLFRLPSERQRYDNMADCYSLVNTIQMLEKAFIQDAVTSKEYEASCSKLLTQFKAAFTQISKEFKTPEEFLRKYGFDDDCRAALDRILDDRPMKTKDDKGNTLASIADIVTIFITLLDRLKLGQKAKDEILPDLRELHDTIGRLTILPSTYQGFERVEAWISKMDPMMASDELNEEQIRQMSYDLETSLNEFNTILKK